MMNITTPNPSKSLKDFKNYLQERHINFVFQGQMSQDMLALVAAKMRKNEPDLLISKRLFAIVIELAQNIHHYSTERAYCQHDKREVGCGLIMIEKMPTRYYITAGNWVNPENKEIIQNKCDKVNIIKKEDLREYYKQQRRVIRKNHSGGNIGFVDLIRKSGSPLQIQFFEDESKADSLFYTIRVCIKKNYRKQA
ncbi:MAG: SiaB family protein kinase [Bernardetiaceae bacterium]|nr:SiaB family protein kinase [Bernardetiaceae bacterium]